MDIMGWHRFKSFAGMLSLIVIFLIGTTIAYFTSTDAVTNRLQSSNFDIILTESKWNPVNGQNLMPNETIDKNPVVTNLENTDAFVFITVKMAYEMQLMEDNNGNYIGTSGVPVPLYKFIVGEEEPDTEYTSTQTVHEGWEMVDEPQTEDNVITYVYAYAQSDKMTPLQKGESTPPLFDKIKLWNFNEKAYGHMQEIIVEAIGIQAGLTVDGQKVETPVEVWSIVKQSG